jgi:signal transduction histidine kinase
VAALCALVAAVLTLLAAGAAVAAAANREQSDTLLDAVGPMRAASDDLLAALIDQEAAVRGFVLNADEAELTPYEEALASQRRQTATIAGSSAVTDRIRVALDRVNTLAEQWRTGTAEPAIAAVRRGDRAAAQAVLGDTARERFDAVRTAVTEVKAGIEAARAATVDSIRDTSSTLLFVLIVAVVFVAAGSVALLVGLELAVIRPVTDLAEQVRTVAQGDYGHAIAAVGPPEVSRLARDVESMRRRIAADLARVHAARVEIERANDLLERQAVELVRSNRDLEQFAYVASHDLQEPLRKVASFCQLLQRRYAGRLDERADQYIAFAVGGAQRMQRLINDLLAFSRIGRVTVGHTDVDLDRVVADAAAGLDGVIESAGAEVTWSDLPVVRGEAALLETLFANLIGNSVKFRRTGRPCRVRITARRTDDGWEIACADNGIGIDPEFADKVFVIFQRLHARDAYPGTGIGLAMAKKIVEYHGGHIWIDPDVTEGATIRFSLPVRVGSDGTGEGARGTAGSDRTGEGPGGPGAAPAGTVTGVGGDDGAPRSVDVVAGPAVGDDGRRAAGLVAP